MLSWAERVVLNRPTAILRVHPRSCPSLYTFGQQPVKHMYKHESRTVAHQIAVRIFGRAEQVRPSGEVIQIVGNRIGLGERIEVNLVEGKEIRRPPASQKGHLGGAERKVNIRWRRGDAPALAFRQLFRFFLTLESIRAVSLLDLHYQKPRSAHFLRSSARWHTYSKA